jgi:hypothetical protein
MSDSEDVAEMVHKLSLFLASPLHVGPRLTHGDMTVRPGCEQPSE